MALSSLHKNVKDKQSRKYQAHQIKANKNKASKNQAKERLSQIMHSAHINDTESQKCNTSSIFDDDSKRDSSSFSKQQDIKKTYPLIVYTREELSKAHAQGAERIIVKGELAQKLKSAFKGLRTLSASSFNMLALCLSGAALFAPFTGGVSLGAAGTVMGTVGAALTATAIAAISTIGLALVIAVYKEYDEVKLSGGGVELVIKKGQKDKSKKQNLNK